MFSDNIRIFEQLHLFSIINEQQKNILTQSYCQLRDLGHKVALQNQEQILLNEDFKPYATKVNKVIEELYQLNE